MSKQRESKKSQNIMQSMEQTLSQGNNIRQKKKNKQKQQQQQQQKTTTKNKTIQNKNKKKQQTKQTKNKYVSSSTSKKCYAWRIFLCFILSIEKQQRVIFLSTELEEIHIKTIPQLGPTFFLNSETDSNVWLCYVWNITDDVFSMFRLKNHFVAFFSGICDFLFYFNDFF